MRYLLGNFVEKINIKGDRLKIIEPSTSHLLHLEKIPVAKIFYEKSTFRVCMPKNRYTH